MSPPISIICLKHWLGYLVFTTFDDIKLNSPHSMLYRWSRFSWARNSSRWRPINLATNARIIIPCSWWIRDEGTMSSSAESETTPGIFMSIDLKIKFNSLVAFYRVVSHWVWCLFPLITPTQLGIDKSQVKFSIFQSKPFQLVQSGEQQSFWIIRVLTESLSIRLWEKSYISG